MSYFDVTAWNLKLSGADNQNIRFLIRRCQRTLVAIPGYGVPILQCLMPLAARHATSLSALLSLALRFRSSESLTDGISDSSPIKNASNRSSPTLVMDSYQQAISNLRSSLFRLQSGQGDIEEAIAVSMILWIFGLPGHEIWSIHLHGLIALLESTPIPASGTQIQSNLHQFATMTAAHLDIRAISIGRHEILSLSVEEKTFSGWEISSGYPESLMTIIALVSAIVEDDLPGKELDPVCREYLEQLAFHSSHAGSGVSPIYGSPMTTNGRNVKLIAFMESIITQWKPPSIPDSVLLETSIPLLVMWEVMRKTAMIYLWRGGFEADITVPLPKEQEITVNRFTREICGGIEQVIQAAEKFHMPMANSLIWPLAVIGNEASRSPTLQAKVQEYLERIYTYFQIPHHQMMATLLQQLWDTLKKGSGAVSGAPLCLHLICLEENIRLPLL
ncbi:hypothetical protein N7493_004775 [Penicillium malachiteum]|uniref:Fungal-specific transcription factor domain-containing protein n=1 Tax=Penicillium malachiteum TaxID=1324776 RepID=A0AAD6MXA7_9EURO|nr:hypothetical protein N7493_004775 [Penicillium malachiteum]